MLEARFRVLVTATPPRSTVMPSLSHRLENKLFVVGGWLGSGAPLAASDLYELDLDTFRWSVPKAKGKGPGPCNMHTSDFVKEKLFVFRGGDGKKYLNDLHVLNVETMEWLGA